MLGVAGGGWGAARPAAWTIRLRKRPWYGLFTGVALAGAGVGKPSTLAEKAAVALCGGLLRVAAHSLSFYVDRTLLCVAVVSRLSLRS